MAGSRGQKSGLQRVVALAHRPAPPVVLAAPEVRAGAPAAPWRDERFPGRRSNWARASRVCLLALLGAVTAVPASARAYRTLADDPTIGAAVPPAWADVTVPWDLYAPELSVSEVAALEDAALAAVDAWAAPTCTAFRGDYRGVASSAASSGDGRNTISVPASWSAAGLPAGKPATTDVRLARDAAGAFTIAEADLYLNFEEFDWSLGAGVDPTRLDLRGILTHEVGHFCGLAHPCEHASPDAPSCESDASYASSALYPDYLGASQRALGADDIAGICALYPGSSCAPACPEGMACSRGMCVETCVGAACDPCADGACSRPLCSSDEECTAGECATFGVAAGMCLPSGSTGTSCDVGADCSSGLCLMTASGALSRCTRPCTNDAECGSGAICALVDGDHVCAPPGTTRAATCAASTGRPTTAPVVLFAGACLALLKRRRRVS